MAPGSQPPSSQRRHIVFTVFIVAWILLMLVIGYVASRHMDPVPIEQWERQEGRRLDRAPLVPATPPQAPGKRVH